MARLELTKQEIHDVVLSGKAYNSDLCRVFISMMKEKCGADVVACYFDYYLKDKEYTEKGFFKKALAETVCKPRKEGHLRVWIRKGTEFPDEACVKELFVSLLQKYSVELEIAGEKIIPEAMASIHFIVTLNGFDDAAIEYILSKASTKINAREKRGQNRFTTYYAFNHINNGKAVICAIFSIESELAKLDDTQKREELTDELYCIVKDFDKWDVLRREDFEPAFVLWDDLSDGQRFYLTREGYPNL